MTDEPGFGPERMSTTETPPAVSAREQTEDTLPERDGWPRPQEAGPGGILTPDQVAELRAEAETAKARWPYPLAMNPERMLVLLASHAALLAEVEQLRAEANELRNGQIVLLEGVAQIDARTRAAEAAVEQQTAALRVFVERAETDGLFKEPWSEDHDDEYALLGNFTLGEIRVARAALRAGAGPGTDG